MTEWHRSYLAALGASGAFCALSFLIWGSGIDAPSVTGGVAFAYGLAGAAAGLMMIMNGAALAVLPYFMIGTAMFFGLGTFASTLPFGEELGFGFPPDIQREMLGKINMIFSAATFVVVAVAGIFFMKLPRADPGQKDGMAEILDDLASRLPLLLLLSAPIIALGYLTFPIPRSAIIQSILSIGTGLPLLSLLVGGARWDRLGHGVRMALVAVFVSESFFGLLLFNKTVMLMPLLSLGLGFAISGRSIGRALVLIGAGVVLYVSVLQAFNSLCRLHPLYDPELNSLEQRIAILSSTSANFSSLAQEMLGESDVMAYQRLILAPYSWYFIDSYDGGMPGDTIFYGLYASIPRVLWPDKPSYTPGQEFAGAYRGWESETFLAIGFPTEAYWSLGWTGVIIGAAIVGVQIGFLTRKWFAFRAHGLSHGGVFILAPLLVFSAAWVERSIGVGFFSGFTRFMVLVIGLDFALRFIMAAATRIRQRHLEMTRS